ncbi:hypothetical protein [Streptomyces sp. NPDC048436]|uniref:hypothetical protein n=1 Tax=Streptomyces sp. NPDC048436 TaxID=3365550 RepID=UPI003711F22F
MQHRPRRLTAALLLLPALLLGACVACAPSPPRARVLPPGDVIRSAQQRLTDACLKRQGLTPPRPGAAPGAPAEREHTTAALFGTGRTELSLALPTGYTVRAHTDGCLASAQRSLYGDQRRWFEVSTIANNLGPEARHTHRTLAEVRAKHRKELTTWHRLRARALTRATSILNH